MSFPAHFAVVRLASSPEVRDEIRSYGLTPAERNPIVPVGVVTPAPG
ncbi:hypothetical protein HCN51_51070 [Nonomuraea sp. FMUSA5-5]|uniref:Uncharacterized protein n=1 Tax=Nonomuraea composti TaxID=2720023 RepID=A0ABX1BPF6_9ACTN|nr:hypothetical protein [Nonomuraea sp. FMUSA5-5]NJP97681.1 hypothetical protein [Nonomuraea sp. FMUSA5-5]